jgi:cation diffusion facilitator CzcD-associated flavoprotein CzcO/acetyl esterase/lipase
LVETKGDHVSTNATQTNAAATPSDTPAQFVQVAVVGAGFAGLYLLHRLSELGLSAVGFDVADDVGGTWYWNRYPGARCDVESLDYSYSFDPELDAEWQWSERYATQPEILGYLQHVADRFDLRRHIRFDTRIDAATWDDDAGLWSLTTSDGDTVTCRYYVMASGCLSLPKAPEIPGADRFKGEVYTTGRWPHEPVDFTGQRVAVIGTGSSAIQSIPIISRQASELTVFQRTPNFSIPAHNGPVDAAKKAEIDADRAGYRERARWSGAGVPRERSEISALSVSDDERLAAYEEAWQTGGLFSLGSAFNDLLVNEAANDTAAEFIRGKIRSIVDDPATAEVLAPTSYPFGTKRPCLDDNYFAVYNEPHVHLVDLRSEPIVTITETGVDTAERSVDVDVLVYATGFDAMTGALVSVDIAGRDGVTLADKWAEGPKTYLGLTTVDFPNLFMITGPGSPSVLSNMVVSIEQHVDFICDTLIHMQSQGFERIEPTPTAESAWGDHVNDYASITLFPQANSWYMGANVPGKPRVFLPYVGGVDRYRATCNEVVERDYLGFRFTGDNAEQVNDGVVCGLQPDVTLMLELLEELEMPPLESLSAEDARVLSAAGRDQRPPGPDVGEIVDGTFPGPGGPLAYRLYRPSSPGPHGIVLYYHGGGWVLGDSVSDDPLCRDLCDRSDAIVISVDYRHAPEAVFPAAADDAIAALAWVRENAQSLGGSADRIVLAGWSAGANLAAVVSQVARADGAAPLRGQALLTPVTDGTTVFLSMNENAEGYMLTRSLMEWFWDHYAAPEQRMDPRASPLLADDLTGLPPAIVVTCEFDPLRDQGEAYARAMAEAGNEVEHIAARGQIHTSIPAVDALPTGAVHREQMAAAIRTFLE